VHQAARDVAMFLAEEIARTEQFRLVSNGEELPVLAFTTTDTVKGWDVFAVSAKLRERGWLVPAYTFPENRTDLAVLRVVCRNGFSHDLADLLLEDLRHSVADLERSAARGNQVSGPSGFRH
jgi:glutamate decarboxylase